MTRFTKRYVVLRLSHHRVRGLGKNMKFFGYGLKPNEFGNGISQCFVFYLCVGANNVAMFLGSTRNNIGAKKNTKIFC